MLSVNDKINILIGRLEDLERSTRYLRDPLQEELDARKELGTEEVILKFLEEQQQKVQVLETMLKDLQDGIN